MNASEISTIIANTINEMFYKIFSSIDNSLYAILDNFTFIDTDILNDYYFKEIFGLTSENGILVIANALVVGYLIYYGFRLLLSYLGITQVESPGKFIIKLIFYTIAMNFSLFICDEMINIIALISRTLRATGEELLEVPICFSSLIIKLNSTLSMENTIDVFSLDGIIKSIISIGLLNLVITYAVRYVLIKVFVFLSPFAILSLCNKGTSILFQSWLKSFLSLMLVQIFVALVLMLILSLNMTSHQLFSKFILMGAIFILMKANQYVREMLGGISSEASLGMNQLKSMFSK